MRGSNTPSPPNNPVRRPRPRARGVNYFPSAVSCRYALQQRRVLELGAISCRRWTGLHQPKKAIRPRDDSSRSSLEIATILPCTAGSTSAADPSKPSDRRLRGRSAAANVRYGRLRSSSSGVRRCRPRVKAKRAIRGPPRKTFHRLREEWYRRGGGATLTLYCYQKG